MKHSSYLRYLQPGQVWESSTNTLYLVLSVNVDRAYVNEVDLRVFNLDNGKLFSFTRSVWETASDIGWRKVT